MQNRQAYKLKDSSLLSEEKETILAVFPFTDTQIVYLTNQALKQYDTLTKQVIQTKEIKLESATLIQPGLLYCRHAQHQSPTGTSTHQHSIINLHGLLIKKGIFFKRDEDVFTSPTLLDDQHILGIHTNQQQLQLYSLKENRASKAQTKVWEIPQQCILAGNDILRIRVIGEKLIAVETRGSDIFILKWQDGKLDTLRYFSAPDEHHLLVGNFNINDRQFVQVYNIYRLNPLGTRLPSIPADRILLNVINLDDLSVAHSKKLSVPALQELHLSPNGNLLGVPMHGHQTVIINPTDFKHFSFRKCHIKQGTQPAVLPNNHIVYVHGADHTLHEAQYTIDTTEELPENRPWELIEQQLFLSISETMAERMENNTTSVLSSSATVVNSLSSSSTASTSTLAPTYVSAGAIDLTELSRLIMTTPPASTTNRPASISASGTTTITPQTSTTTTTITRPEPHRISIAGNPSGFQYSSPSTVETPRPPQNENTSRRARNPRSGSCCFL